MMQWFFQRRTALKSAKGKLRGRHVTALSSAEVEAVFGAAVAATKAENFAAGLPVTGELDGQIVNLYEDGCIELAGNAPRGTGRPL
jgi:hypothetical protein